LNLEPALILALTKIRHRIQAETSTLISLTSQKKKVINDNIFEEWCLLGCYDVWLL
jgi:hypothetical protein